MSDNPYICAIHEPPPDPWLEQYMTVSGRAAGWIVHTHGLGHNPADLSGYDYSSWSTRGYGNIARLNNGYGPTQGTIPIDPAQYANFAMRVQNWVKSSSGCRHWVIGNEPNAGVEGKHSKEHYAQCFKLCYAMIKEVQPDSVVMAAPVAMWNVETEDWLVYYSQGLELCAPVDALCWHTYTHGSDSSLITDMTTMNVPYQDRLYHFRAYQDLWAWTPDRYKSYDVYLTEMDQGDVGGVRNPWRNEQGVNWLQAAYAELNEWNEQHSGQIKCGAAYRWPKIDEWYIESKEHVYTDMRLAVDRAYRTEEETDMILIGSESFNGPYVPRDDPNPPYDQNVGELKIQQGWEGFWVWQGVNPPDPTQMRRPEFFVSHGDDPDDQLDLCQAVQTTFSTSDNCVWKKFTTAPGAELLVNVRAMIDSDPLAQHALVMGIDPLGGEDMFSSSVQWSEWLNQSVPMKKWHDLTIDGVIAQANRCTVFLRSKTDYAKNSAGHWDDLELYADLESPPDPPDPGEGHTITTVSITYLDGKEIARSESTAQITCGDVDPQACALAQQLAAMLCLSA